MKLVKVLAVTALLGIASGVFAAQAPTSNDPNKLLDTTKDSNHNNTDPNSESTRSSKAEH